MNKDAYQSLLNPIVTDYRTRDYAFWVPYVSGEPIVLDVAAPDGTECCVEISAVWDDRPAGNVRVMLSIDNGGWRAFVPITDSFIIAPDGSFVGE